MERLRISGEAPLRLDHRSQLIPEVDVRILQRSGANGAQSLPSGSPDLHVSGRNTRRIDVTDFRRKAIAGWEIGEWYPEGGQYRPIRKDRANQTRVVDLHLVNGRRGVAVDRCLEAK